MPHENLTHIFLFINCRESGYFEHILKLNFPLTDDLQPFLGLLYVPHGVKNTTYFDIYCI